VSDSPPSRASGRGDAPNPFVPANSASDHQLELGDDLGGIVTYDDCLVEAAHRHGIPVIAPG
jgi:hypothetical protein